MKRLLLSPIIQILLLLLFCILIWFFGGELHFKSWTPLKSLTYRLIAITILSGSYIIFKTVKYCHTTFFSKTKQASLPNDLSKEEDETFALFKCEARNIILDLKNLEILNGEDSISVNKLPWYLIVGPTANGKTSFIEKSGLNFPTLDKDKKYQNSEGEKLKSFVTDEAVFLEYSTLQTDDMWHSANNKRNWQTVLETLKKYKKGRTLHGLIVTLDITSFIQDNDNQRKNKIDALRQYIMDVHQFLNLRLPLYFVMTKCDKIAGFLEYFGDLEIEASQLIVGLTLPLRTSKNKILNTNLETAYDEFLVQLRTKVFWSLHREQDLERRERLCLFPQQLFLFKNLLLDNFANIFNPNKLYEMVEPRGIYFTSAIPQNGSVTDPLGNLITKQFGISLPLKRQVSIQPRTMFIKQLLLDIVHNEVNLVNYSTHVDHIRKFTRNFALAFSAAMVLLGSFSLVQGYLYNKDQLEKIELLLKNYQINNIDYDNTSIESILPYLSLLADCLDIYNNNERPFISDVFQSGEMKEKLEEKFTNSLLVDFLPLVSKKIEAQLIAENEDFDALYSILKAYLALGNNSQYPQVWIENAGNFIWNSETLANGTTTKRCNALLHYALTKTEFRPININSALVNKTIDILLQVPLEARIYTNVKLKFQQKHNATLSLLNVANNGSTSFEDFEGSNSSVPTLYTQKGFIELLSPEVFSTVKAFYNDGILVSEKKQNTNVKPADEIIKNVNNLYMQDYITHWHLAADSLRIKSFNNLDNAMQSINTLRGDHSTVKNLLTHIASNMAIVLKTDKNIDLNDWLVTLTRLGNNETIDKTINLDNIIKNFDELYLYLNKIKHEDDINKASYMATRAIMEAQIDNPFENLILYGSQLPNPLDTWLQSVATNTWKVLMENSNQYINSLWTKDIIPKYEILRTHYPFNEKSNQWVSIDEFDDFFAQKGTIETFFETYLKSFIDTSTSPWQWQSKYSSALSQTTITASQFENLLAIKNSPISSNKKIELDFVVTPVNLSANAASVLFKVENQQFTYQHGPQQDYNFKCPSQSQTEKITITFKDFDNKIFTHNFDGPWSLLKMMKHGKVEKIANSENYRLTITMGDYSADFEIKKLNSKLLAPFNKIKHAKIPENL